MNAYKTVTLLAALLTTACGGLDEAPLPTPDPTPDVPTPTTYVETDHFGIQNITEVTAFFHNPDGSYAGSVPVTDGRAAIENLPDGGAVTLAIRYEDSRLLVTTNDVTPGTTLRLKDNYPASDSVLVQVNWDPTEVPEAESFRMRYSCNSRTLVSGRDEVNISSCSEPATFAVLVARDSNREPIAYALVSTGELVEDMQIDFTEADWRTDFEDVDIAISNPQTSGNIYVETTASRGGTTLSVGNADGTVALGGTMLVTEKTFGQADSLLTTVYAEAGTGYSQATIPVELSSPQQPVAIDLQADLLPAIESLAINLSSGTVRAEIASAAHCPVGGDADIGIWTIDENQPTGSFTWLIASKGASTELALPSFGPEAAAWSLAEGANMAYGYRIIADAERDYDLMQASWVEFLFQRTQNVGCSVESSAFPL